MKNFLQNFLTDKNIEIYSLIYIIIPYIIFAFGWLKLPFAIVLSVLIILSVFFYAKNLDNKEIFLKDKNLKYFMITILILLVWCLLSGMGGFGFQNNPDWEKNNAIFHDLFINKWPIIYKDYSFVYYLGYYLPSGLIMKLFGWNIGYLFSFLWGFSGLILAVYWIKRLVGNFSPLVILSFIFFSGLDALGLIIKQFIFPNMPPIILHGNHVEWWAGLFQFSSITTTLFWVPQYAIQGWLLTALILHNIKNHNSSQNLLFLWALCSFGTPFIFIAIFPLIIAGVFSTKAKKLFSFQNFVVSPVIIFAVFAYFTSKAFKDPVNAISNSIDSYYFIIIYFIFIIAEFGLYALIINKYFKNSIIWNTNLILMLLMPFIKIGAGNDFVMRGSVCYLFILFIYLARALFNETKKIELKRFQKILLLIIFLIGTFTPLLEIKRSLTNYSAKVPVLNEQLSVMDLYKYRNNSQYLGNKEAFFWKYLAK